MRQILATLIGIFCLTAALHADIRINTRFNPAKVGLGNRSQYIVEIVETSTDRMPKPEGVNSLPIPIAGGLELTNGRTSSNSQTNFVNGRSTYTHTQSLIIDAKASKTGTFSIPGYEVTYKGQKLVAPAAKLTVVERSADAEPTLDELIFLQAEIPNSLYIGQTIPIKLKLYISDQMSLSRLNAFDRNADGFIISDLPEESSESVEMYDGRRYRVLTWPLSVTPIQTGQQDIAFQFTVTARTGRSTSPFGGRQSPFGRSLFDDFFGSSERFNVYTDPVSINVQALPRVDKPVSHSGAIGDFNMQVYTDLKTTKVGEPIMLSMKITGTGNFDRIQGPPMPDSPNWRSYDPESQFEPSDALGLKGTKRFDYVFIPRKAGTLQLPDIRFAFLDPKSGQYVELKSPPLSVKVTPNLNQPATVQQPVVPNNAQQATDSSIELSRSLTPEEALLTLDYQPKPGRLIDGNLLKSNAFYIGNALILVAMAGFSVWLKQQKRLRADANYAQLQAATQEFKVARKAANSAQDATAFYANAQQAIRLAATRHSGRNLRNAEQPELDALLSDAAAKEALHQLFDAADALRFAPQAGNADLSTARQQFETILKAL